tara:strand:- start:100 stop:519 length:420 start_codon:yes stop_codon:yes gene_type:complete
MHAEIVDKFFEAMTNRDVDTALSFMHENCVNTDTGTGQVMTGLAENRADMENWLTTFSDMKVEVVSHVESGAMVATEMKMSAVNTGDMEMPDGSKIPATGKSIQMTGCQIAHFEGDKMVKTTMYYNMMAMMSQLGLVPS